MGRKKEWYMDYAVHAFTFYALMGRPTREEYVERLHRTGQDIDKMQGAVLDIEAVNKMLEQLQEEHRQYIIAAVEETYFKNTRGKPEYGDIKLAVTRLTFQLYASDRTVQRWLEYAKLLFSKLRGLNTGADGDLW